jgi:acetyltransferase-like isoleucine patch superfamily enzyme
MKFKSKKNLKIKFKSNKEMKSFKNLLLHGFYFSLYGFVKYLSFPFFNYLRFLIIRLFSPNFRTTSVSDGVTIYFPWRVSVDRCSTLNQGVIIDGFGGVTIGKGVRIAPNTIINTADHVFKNKKDFFYKQGFNCLPVKICDNVWIGSNCTINKGVTIGNSVVIGSGSVVTKDIPANSLAVGIPAKVIKTL